eukprot:1982178-Rhodomonas_salina.1
MEDQSMVPNKRKECQEEESATVGRSPKQPSVSRDLLGVELKSDDLQQEKAADNQGRQESIEGGFSFSHALPVFRSAVLSKLGAFLPALQQANVQLEQVLKLSSFKTLACGDIVTGWGVMQKLQSEGAAAVTIESVDKDKPHISMVSCHTAFAACCLSNRP